MATDMTRIQKIAMAAGKINGEVHLACMRDTFSALDPLFISVGVVSLIICGIIRNFLSGAFAERLVAWFGVLVGGLFGLSAVLFVVVYGYLLGQRRGAESPVFTAVLSVVAFVASSGDQVIGADSILMSSRIEGADSALMNGRIADAGSQVVGVDRVFAIGQGFGVDAVLAGIIVAILTVEVYLFFANAKWFQIRFPDAVPPAVADSLNGLLPILMVLICCGCAGMIAGLLGIEAGVVGLLSDYVQKPLITVCTSLVGCLILYALGNLFFTQGIHQVIVYGNILEPLLIINVLRNMEAYALGNPIPDIINVSFVPTFGMLGGSGGTVSLILATLLFGRSAQKKENAKMATMPGLFNINEPVIFGYPVQYNRRFIVPFILVPAVGIGIAYGATAMGWMKPCVVMLPWTVPPLLSGFLATAGDWHAVVVQAVIILVGVVIYLPFMRWDERSEQESETIADDSEEW